MRLWHYQLLPGLPKEQLISQWRECCKIAYDIKATGKPTNHILINKINDYPLDEFKIYCNLLIKEMTRRGIKVSTATMNRLYDCLKEYCNIIVDNDKPIFKNWHNYTYMDICFYNLNEKYLCGGITNEDWLKFKNIYFERRTLLNEGQIGRQNEEIRKYRNSKISSTWVTYSCKDRW